jgi:translation initiation factor 2 alpha subunit (eIF-2alpha)
MADGHLNKCKKCARLDVHENTKLKKTDINWVLKEAERCRVKARKSIVDGTFKKVSSEQKAETMQRYAEKFPEKVIALRLASKLEKKSCSVCGDKNGQRHHEDYSKPLDVIWLCSKHHSELHVKKRIAEKIKSFTIVTT